MSDARLFDRLRRRLFIFQLFLLLAGSCAVAYGALRAVQSDLNPDITRKGDLVARSLSAQIGRAVTYGIPFDGLRGAETLFATLMNANAEILFIAATDRGLRTTFVSGLPDASTLDDVIRALPPTRPQSGEAAEVRSIVEHGSYLIAVRSIIVRDERVGFVLVGLDAHFVQQRIIEIFYDILVVLVVSLLMTFELLLLIMTGASAPMLALQAVFTKRWGEGRSDRSSARLGRELEDVTARFGAILSRLSSRCAELALRARGSPGDAAVHDDLAKAEIALRRLERPPEGSAVPRNGLTLVCIRMPLFVFFCAEELSRSFFPTYARGLYQAASGLSPEIAISLPITVFMLVVALLQPISGPWVERLGARRVLLAGALVGSGGLALTAAADGFLMLVALRLITAVGYGLVFVAGQGFIVANTDGSNRAWGLAMFVGSVLAASICGPAIGGMLADGVGYRRTFLVGGALAIASACLAGYLLPRARPAASHVRSLRLRDVGILMRNSRFVSLVVLAAMPAKIILTGFLYYLVPLFLEQLGNSKSAAGRTMMLYGLMMVLVTPLTARLVDRVGQPLLFVIAGGILSGAGLMGVLWSPSMETILVSITLLGVAQAVSITPQLSLVPVACPSECRELGQITVIGFFRLFERIGSALGPILAALLLQSFGYPASIATIGCAVIAGCALLGASWYGSERRQRLHVPAPSAP